MSNDNVFKLIQPGCFDDQLTAILRQDARTLLPHAVEVEVADFLAKHAGLKTEDGRQRIVRHEQELGLSFRLFFVRSFVQN